MTKNQKLRKTGLDIIGDVSWGTHLCVFYESKEDLIDILAPYFKIGLENNEFCIWITSEPITVEEAKNAIERVMPDFDRYFKKGQIEIVPHTEWYFKEGIFDLQRVLNAWIDKLNQALSKGFDGIRVTGNTVWLEKRNWEDFTNYEEEINKAIGKYRMLGICTYSLDKCKTSEIIDVIRNHQSALIRRGGKWELIESSTRKEMKKELKEAEQKFKIIFDNATDGILIADLETRKFLMGNKMICQMLGYSLEEIEKLRVMDIHPEKDLPDVIEQFETQKKGEFTLAKDLPTKRKDGSIFYADVNSSPIILDGRPYMLGIFRDITERKKAEEALRGSQERYAKLVENLPVGVYRNTPGPQGHFIEANEAIVKMFEADSKEEFLEHSVSDLYWDPSQRQQFSEKILRQGFMKNEVLELKTLKGNKMWCSLNTVAKKDKNGNFYFDGIIQNITEQKKTGKNLKEYASKLEEQKLSLEQKNLALKEMIEHIERTKNRTKEDIAINIDEIIMPIVEKLKIKGASPKYVKLLRYHLKELSSAFGHKITQKSVKLTPREIEICNALRGGLSSKDLAELLNVSQQTIEKHRKNIRKKLGLSNKKANLISYLQNI